MSDPKTAAEWMEQQEEWLTRLTIAGLLDRNSAALCLGVALAMLRDAKAELEKAERAEQAQSGCYSGHRFVGFKGWAAIEARFQKGDYAK